MKSEHIVKTFDSGKKGTHHYVLGAVHGNEPVGVKLIDYCINNTIIPQSGKVSYIFANPRAYAMNTRFLESNMNREFGVFSETYEGRVAKDIVDFISKDPGVIIDFHSTSTDMEPFAAYNGKDIYSKQLADYIPVDTALKVDPDKMIGLAIAAMPGVAIECGSHNSDQGIDVAIASIKNIFSTNPAVHHKKVLEMIDIIPAGIRFSRGTKSNQNYERSDVVGTIKRESYIANQAMSLFMPDFNSSPNDYDAGVFVREI